MATASGTVCGFDKCVKNVVGPSTKCRGCSIIFCNDHFDFFNHECQLGVEAVTDDYPCQGCRTINSKLQDLESEVILLKGQRDSSMSQVQQLQLKILSLEGQLFETKQEVKKAETDSNRVNELRDENNKLSKDILVMGELYQRTKEKLDSLTCYSVSSGIIRQQFQGNNNTMSSSCLLANLSLNSNTSLAAAKKIERLDRELHKERKAKDDLHRDRDFFRARANEMEFIMEEKDKEWKAKLSTEKDRIHALEKANRLLEKHILSQNEKLGLTPTTPLSDLAEH